MPYASQVATDTILILPFSQDGMKYDDSWSLVITRVVSENHNAHLK